jgi:hypothetical protein
MAMISRYVMDEYRRMNSTDRASFRRWLTLNTVVGASAFTLIAIVAINASFSGGASSPTDIAKYTEAMQRADTK